MKWKSRIIPWIFLFPWLLGFISLTLWPFAISFYWSFCRYDLLNPPEFVGTENYRRLASEIIAGEGFGLALWNTAYYALVSTPLSIALGIALAMLCSWRVPGQSIFRALFFLPSIVPVVAASVLWMWLLEPRGGMVNFLLRRVGLPAPNWLRSTSEAAWLPDWFAGLGGFGSKDALVLMTVWGVGNFMVIYLAALGDIPRATYEAAALDGAGPWAKFRLITLPLLSPIIFFNLIMGLIRSVQAFTQIYLLSEGRGEPVGSTLVLSLHLFLSAFQDLNMGYASAVSWVLFFVLASASAALFASSKRWVFYQGLAR